MAVFLRIYRVVLVAGMGTAGDGVSRAGENAYGMPNPRLLLVRLQLCTGG